MTLSGTRGLVRVSINPHCRTLAAMTAERVREPEFYRAVTGAPYPGEYGERLAARRRGSKFESQLHANDAAKLRHALAERYGHDADRMWVRNFAEEVPGPPTGMRAMRLTRMRGIWRDLAAGRPVPALLIQPQLRLPIDDDHFEYISPDFLVLDNECAMYVPGEEKSFVVRDNVVDPSDLDLTRRQAAAQILALRAEADRVGLADRVEPRAAFVFASIAGLSPAPAREEYLRAEVEAVTRAMAVLAAVRADLARLRIHSHEPLAMLVDELGTAFADSCLNSCILAEHCQARHVGTARALGDGVARVLGAETDTERLRDLLDPAAVHVDPGERALAVRLQEAGAALGLTTDEMIARLA